MTIKTKQTIIIIIAIIIIVIISGWIGASAKADIRTYLAQVFSDGSEAYPPPAAVSTSVEINLPIVCTPTESNPTPTAHSGDPLPMPTATPPAARPTDKPKVTDTLQPTDEPPWQCPREPCDPKATPFETPIREP